MTAAQLPENYVPVPLQWDGLRVDKCLLEYLPAASFAEVNRWCRTGQVRLDGRRVKANHRVKTGQMLRLPPPAMEKRVSDYRTNFKLSAAQKADIKSWIIHEEDEFLVLNKPAGVPTQAGHKHYRSVDRLLAAYFDDADPPKLVHRLDLYTSGCLVVAKTAHAARTLGKALMARDVQKVYLAITTGEPPAEKGIIDAPLCKIQQADKGRVLITPEGQSAVTGYKVLQRAGEYNLIEAQPKTGRTHQIRAHLAHIGCPIVGDDLYGGTELPDEIKNMDDIKNNRFLLHAQSITFEFEGEQRFFTVPAPKEFKSIFPTN